MVKFAATVLPKDLAIEPDVYGDAHRHFMVAWNGRSFREATGLDVRFEQWACVGRRRAPDAGSI